MKVGQKSFVRWVSKLMAQGASRPARKATSAGLHELSAEQLRRIGGGDGQTSTPYKGW